MNRLQTVCEKEPSSSMTYDAFFEGYMNYCGKYDLNSVSQSELLKLVSKMISESALSTQPPLVLGLRPRIEEERDEASVQSVISSVDGLGNGEGQQGNICGIGECKTLGAFASPAALWTHVSGHSRDQKSDQKTCPWDDCGKIIQEPSKVLSHLSTHIPLPDVSASLSAPTQKKAKFPPMPNVPMYQHDVNDELKGVQLTSLLVIRNLARNPSNAPLFSSIMTSLAALLTSSKYSKTVSSIFAELK
jgi:hypothetical protein